MAPVKNGQAHGPRSDLSSQFFSVPVILVSGIIMFAPLIEGGTTHLPVLIIRLTLLGALAVWMINEMKTGRCTLSRHGVLSLGAAFLAWAVLTFLWSPYKNVSLQWLVSFFIYGVFFLMVFQRVQSVGQVRMLVMVILWMGLFEGSVGIFQYVWLGEPRAKGTFFNPNFFAAYEGVVLVLALALLSFQDLRELERRNKWFLIGTVLMTFTAFVLAQSRGATFALLGSLLLVCVYRFGKAGVLVLLIIVLSGVLIPNPLRHRFQEVSSYDPYAYTRVDIWKNSLQRILDAPLGVGLGIYKYSSFQHRFPIDDGIVRFQKRAQTAHSGYIQIAVELGVPGICLFLAGIALWGREVSQLMSQPLMPWERGGVIGLVAGVSGLLLHAAVDSVFHEPTLVLQLLLLSSLVLTIKRIKNPLDSKAWAFPFPYHPVRLCLVICFVVLLGLLSAQPAVAWYLYERGNAELPEGQGRQALQWYRYATFVNPGSTAYHDQIAFTQARLYHASGNTQWLIRAIQEIKICEALNSLDGRFPRRLGKLYLLLSEREKKIQHRDALVRKAAGSFEKAITLDPFFPFNYTALGNIRVTQGRVDEAQRLFHRVLEFEPNFLPSRVLLAELAWKADEPAAVTSQLAGIQAIQQQFRGRTLDAMERRFLNVNVAHLEASLRKQVSP